MTYSVVIVEVGNQVGLEVTVIGVEVGITVMGIQRKGSGASTSLMMRIWDFQKASRTLQVIKY